MGFDFAYELIAPAARTDRLVAALLPHLCREDRTRLRGVLPWRPAYTETYSWHGGEQVHLRHGIGGLEADGVDDGYCVSMLFRPDEAIDEYASWSPRDPRGRPRSELGRVSIGCVWMRLSVGQALCVLEATAASTSMSILFDSSPSIRHVFQRIARAARALALFFDHEQEELVLCARRERMVARPSHEPYELEEFGALHVDAYYGALLAAARIRPLPVAA